MSDEKDKKSDKEKKGRKGTDEELGEVSYTYWKRESDLQADHKGFQPEKVTNPPQEINNPSQNQQGQIGSAWNKAGTWEEKKVTKIQLESFFNEYINKNKKEYKDAFYFDKFSDYSGDVRNNFLKFILQTYFVYSRGKIKYFYDCSIKLKIRGNKNYDNLTTKITIKEINNADEDDHFQYEFDSTDSNSTSKKYPLINNFKSAKNDIEKDIRKIFSELKESFLNK